MDDMIMLYWCNDINRVKAKVLGEKPALVPHFRTHTPHSLVWNQIWVSMVTGQQLVT